MSPPGVEAVIEARGNGRDEDDDGIEEEESNIIWIFIFLVLKLIYFLDAIWFQTCVILYYDWLYNISYKVFNHKLNLLCYLFRN